MTARILLTGMSGTGKSTALAELARRGYRVVDTDDEGWCVDVAGDWLWDERRIADLLASDDPRTLFVSGCVSNQGRFYDRFDAVVLLSAPTDVILERIETRTTNPYGKGRGERARILGHIATVEPLLRVSATHEIDASRPLAEVVDALVGIARASGNPEARRH